MRDIKLENSKAIAILSTYGGNINSFYNKENKFEHIWQYNSEIWPRRTNLCFPICGALKNQEYSYKGKTYHMENHGYARETEFSVIEECNTKLVLHTQSNKETKLIYPFDYELDIIYTLLEDSLLIEYKVTNTGLDEMFYSIGNHYAYNLRENKENSSFYFSSIQKTGEIDFSKGCLSDDIFHSRDYYPIKEATKVDSTPLIYNTLNTDWVGVGDKNGVITKVIGEGFNYLVLWAPKGEKTKGACIEFWDGLKDFDNASGNLEEKKGIRSLKKGESRSYSQRILL